MYQVLNEQVHIIFQDILVKVASEDFLGFFKTAIVTNISSQSAQFTICPGSIPSVGHLSQYVYQPPRLTQPGHPLVGRRSEYQPRALTPCGWGVKAGMVCMWVAGETVIPLLHTSHI